MVRSVANWRVSALIGAVAPQCQPDVAIQECGPSVGLLADGCVGMLADGSMFPRENKSLDFSSLLPQVCRDIKATQIREYTLTSFF